MVMNEIVVNDVLGVFHTALIDFCAARLDYTRSSLIRLFSLSVHLYAAKRRMSCIPPHQGTLAPSVFFLH